MTSSHLCRAGAGASRSWQWFVHRRIRLPRGAGMEKGEKRASHHLTRTLSWKERDPRHHGGILAALLRQLPLEAGDVRLHRGLQAAEHRHGIEAHREAYGDDRDEYRDLSRRQIGEGLVLRV